MAELGMEACVEGVHAVAVDGLRQPGVAALAAVAFESLVAFDRLQQIPTVLRELFRCRPAGVGPDEPLVVEERRFRLLIES